MKKTWALLLVIALLLTMAGCGSKKEYLAGAVSDTGVVAIGVPTEPVNTDPALYDGGLAARAMMGLLYEGLTAVNEEGIAVGAAAKSWEVTTTDDAAKRPVYTFTLRQGACWSDGSTVKAEDFIEAWTRIISGAVESPYRYLFDVILGAKDYENEESELGLAVTEDGALQVTLEGDFAGFVHMLAAPAFYPVKEGERVYNGRYAMTALSDNVATLSPNGGYRGEKTGTGLTLKYYSGDMAALEKLAADGTLQATYGYAGGNAPAVTGSDGVQYCYVVNTTRLTDAETRLAVKQLAAGEEVTGTLPGEITLLMPDYAAAAETAGADELRQRVEQAGVTLNLQKLSYEEYKRAREDGGYDLLYLAVSADYPDEAVLLGRFVSEAAGNYAGYNNEKFDELLSKAAAETDEAARAALLQEARLLLESDGVLIPWGEGKTELYCNAALSGITCDAQGLWDFGGAKYAA